MYSDTVSLYDIAGCRLYGSGKTKYTIPNIQRGLVWNALQMELLWDSILREFPIGSLLILNQSDSPGEILDGQQRANAIVAGSSTYELFGDDSPKSILWYDLAFKVSESDAENRCSGIYLTNRSHPWGFDRDGKRLNAADRRKSLEKAYDGKNKPGKTEWDIRRFMPYCHDKNSPDFFPVPLPVLVTAARGKNMDNSGDIEDFKNEVFDNIDRFASYSLFTKENNEKIKGRFEELCRDKGFIRKFFKLNEYRIAVNFIDAAEDVEILFDRINTKGTRITDAELAYATLKHHGAILCKCPEIGNVIKKISSGHMLEQTLAQIAIRYCLSSEKEISGFVDSGKIRKLQSNDALVSLFENNGAKLNEIIDCASRIVRLSPDSCSLPAYMEADIANNDTNLYILLLKFVEKLKRNLCEDFDGRFIQAAVFYLHLFSTNNNPPVNLIFQKLSGPGKIKKETIQNVLRDSISAEYTYPMIYSFRGFKALEDSEFSNSWKPDSYTQEPGYKIFESLFGFDGVSSENAPGRFMLKYAQRHYYEKVFGDYNPSDREYWEDINRPWDHDHIIPQIWGENTNEEWKPAVKSWINCMGNIADIPFEQNREKRDSADWDYYKEYPDDLFFDDDAATLNKENFRMGIKPEIDKFVSVTKKRFLKISDDFLNLFKILGLEEKLSLSQEKRKKMFLRIKEKYHPDWDLYCTYDFNKKDTPVNVNNVTDWQSPWITIMDGVTSGSRSDAVTAYSRINGKYVIERGKRKPYNMIIDDIADNQLWEKGTFYRIAPDDILDKNGDLSVPVDLLVNGARDFNRETGLADSFCADSNSLISFKKEINGLEILSYLYLRYNRYHCMLQVSGEQAPAERIGKFCSENEFEEKSERVFDKRMAMQRSDEDIRDAYDTFKELMIKLNRELC